MDQGSAASAVCRSVFRQDAEATTSENYTRVWVRLINQLEKNKRVQRTPIDQDTAPRV